MALMPEPGGGINDLTTAAKATGGLLKRF